MTGKDAATATKRLSIAFGADMRSAKVSQLQQMSEAAYVQSTTTPKLIVEGGRAHVHPQGQPWAVDRSGNDWRAACLYCEAHLLKFCQRQRLIARNTQYVTRAGPKKFESKDGHVKRFKNHSTLDSKRLGQA